jgi:hypothetical protein
MLLDRVACFLEIFAIQSLLFIIFFTLLFWNYVFFQNQNLHLLCTTMWLELNGGCTESQVALFVIQLVFIAG